MIINIQEITLAPVVRSSANAKMNIDEVIGNLKHKAFLSRSAVSSHQKLSAVQQLIIETECEWTNRLQDLVDFGNKRLPRNFSLRLEMDDNEPEMHRQCVYPEKEVNT
jgi:hypothetical protein